MITHANLKAKFTMSDRFFQIRIYQLRFLTYNYLRGLLSRSYFARRLVRYFELLRIQSHYRIFVQ